MPNEQPLIGKKILTKKKNILKGAFTHAFLRSFLVCRKQGKLFKNVMQSGKHKHKWEVVATTKVPWYTKYEIAKKYRTKMLDITNLR